MRFHHPLLVLLVVVVMVISESLLRRRRRRTSSVASVFLRTSFSPNTRSTTAAPHDKFEEETPLPFVRRLLLRTCVVVQSVR